MGQNFIACDREQSFLMPPDVREWLPEGHLTWFVIDAVGEMDLASFYGGYRADGHGRPAYEPAMMVALLLWADEGRPPVRAPAEPYRPPATPDGEINVTDPDSRTVKALLVVAAEIMVASPDFGHVEPMLDATRRELDAAGVPDTPNVVLADAVYWHHEQMERIVDRGIEVLSPPDSKPPQSTAPRLDRRRLRLHAPRP